MSSLQTIIETGADVNSFLEMIFSNSEDRNVAEELNILDEFLSDAKSTYDLLSWEASQASSELGMVNRLETDVRRDMLVCMNIICTLEVMIKQREEV